MTFLRSGFEPFCDGVDLGNIESSMGWCLFGGVRLLATDMTLWRRCSGEKRASNVKQISKR